MVKEIYLQGQGQKWSLGNDFQNYRNFFPSYGLKISKSFIPFNKIVYLSNKYTACKSILHHLKNKLVFDYFHGHPKISPEFENIFKNIQENIHKFSRIRVSNSIIEKLFIDHGLEKKISKIFLGVETEKFKFNLKTKNYLKEKLKISKNSIVIGSFQKDSVGWAKSKSPKLIKGPDILIKAISKIYSAYENIFIILVGPEREYVKQELSNLGIPFCHFYEDEYYNIIKYYSLLDFYFISSREEGGPKTLLEAMSCGVPVISTPVGQANDIIDNFNSFKSETFEADEISSIFLNNIKKKNLNDVKNRAEKTAKIHDFSNQKETWKSFFSI